ncbi:MAG: glycosyltransferase family 2 protein [Hungatella sp.]|nr:glycosyltransferase family 2 protein [Hungatella sp.]
MDENQLPLLSVIIPFYNVENYIEKSVKSIIDQSYKNIQIVLIDDGSTDKSGMFADRIALEDRRVLVFHQENRGVSAARNMGMKNANGDYITFVDADDYLEKEAFSVLIHELIKNKCDGAIYPFSMDYHNKSIIDALPWPDKTILTKKEILEVLIPSMIAVKRNKKTINGSVSRTIFRRKAIEGFWFDERIHMQEDLIFCIQTYAHMENLEIVNEVVYHYVKHGKTTTERYRKNYLCETINLEKEIIKVLQENGLHRILLKRYWARRIAVYSLCLSNLFRFDAPEDIDLELEEVINEFRKDKYVTNSLAITYLRRGMIIPYILLHLKRKNLIKWIYKKKEQYRQKKLTI